MIPDAKQPAVARALRETFGVDAPEDIRRLTGGPSTALLFRIVVKGHPYLLRLILREDAQSDPTWQLGCMKIAAEAGIAPRIWYASAADRLSITDFVEAKPMPGDAATRIADAIRRLHALPSFPRSASYLDTIDSFVQRFQEARLLPERATDDLVRRYGRLAKVYPRGDADLVASHNDLTPDNILFDGERVWLVDWEEASLNDRYADLAVAASFFVRNEADEEAYLRAYFGEPAGEHRRARLYLMRQAVHVFNATRFMLLAAASGKAFDPEMTAPDSRAFHSRLASGETSLATDEGKLEYAKAHLMQALRGMQAQRFDDAIARLASGA
ncbi:phosphotransferase [Sorangium sp. So ce1097]|uniref:phosphotransferase n=1 Tax=Sorangium sp. So ce1097 TaxID=3133330 RepID=UPI003F6076B5